MAGAPDSGASAVHVQVRHPAAAAVLLRLAGEGVDAGERAAVLSTLVLLCSSASLAQRAQRANADLLMAAPCCWQHNLLDCLAAAVAADGGGGAQQPGQAAQHQLAAAAAAYDLLVLLLARGLAASASGRHQLEAVVSLLKAQPGRQFSFPDRSARRSSTGGPAAADPLARADSWQLLQALLADVTLELLAAQAAYSAATDRPSAGSPAAGAGQAQAAARQLSRGQSSEWEAWTVVSEWSTEPYCSNAAALLSLLDDFLAGLVVPPPGGHAGL